METRFIEVAEGIELWVQSRGNKSGEACLFVNGAGANASSWDETLLNSLVDKGYYVITYDHRDFGYSSKVDFDTSPFDVMDLTQDAMLVLDELGIEKVHVIGQSMGGFIAQLMAIYYPERVRSLTSISSSTSSPNIPPPPEKTWRVMLENKPTGDLEHDLDGFMKVWKYLNGSAVFDEALAEEYTRNLYERQEIKGALGESHVKAQSNLFDRCAKLKKLSVPCLVIHGEQDYLVSPTGGARTAECIEDSRLVLIPDMGHMLFNQDILERVNKEIVEFLGEIQEQEQ